MRHLVLCLAYVFIATPAFAQQTDRIPSFAFDARGIFGTMKADEVTTTSLGITGVDLPTHGFGVAGGAQWYPLRRRAFALGLGGEMLFLNGSQQTTDATGAPMGPLVHRKLQTYTFQLSFNFGHRQGWSYITGGIGPLEFDTYLEDGVPDGLRPMTPNLGFGARWFNNQHVAFVLDLRFYMSEPAKATAVVGERERQALVMMSAGISIK